MTEHPTVPAQGAERWYCVDEKGNDNFATSIYESGDKGLLVARCNQNGQYPWQGPAIIRGLEANKGPLAKRPVAFRVPRLLGDMVSHYFVTTSEDEARAMADTNQVEYEGLYLVADRSSQAAAPTQGVDASGPQGDWEHDIWLANLKPDEIRHIKYKIVDFIHDKDGAFDCRISQHDIRVLCQALSDLSVRAALVQQSEERSAKSKAVDDDLDPPAKWLDGALRNLARDLVADPNTPWIGERDHKQHICWTAADRLASRSPAGCGTPGYTDPNCNYANEPAPDWKQDQAETSRLPPERTAIALAAQRLAEQVPAECRDPDPNDIWEAYLEETEARSPQSALAFAVDYLLQKFDMRPK